MTDPVLPPRHVFQIAPVAFEVVNDRV
jgi:hypothetical protein